MKRKSQGKTCIICGQRKSNESFSGGGHAKNICKKCARLSKGERDERVLINRIENIGLRMDRKKWKWLEEMRNDPRENVRRAAEEVYQHESARYREFKEALRKDEEALEAYLSSLPRDEELEAWILENETDDDLSMEFNELYEKGYYDEIIDEMAREEKEMVSIPSPLSFPE